MKRNKLLLSTLLLPLLTLWGCGDTSDPDGTGDGATDGSTDGGADGGDGDGSDGSDGDDGSTGGDDGGGGDAGDDGSTGDDGGADDDGGDDGDTGDDGGGADPDEPPPEVMGCGDATLLESPTGWGERGPWPVGARTVTIDELTVEVWYPAELGSAEDKDAVVYDLREYIPEEQSGNGIDDSQNPWQDCDCYRDLPIDADHGPYPTVLFVHGTAGFRTQSLSQMTHWASRGFVVVAADHPGLYLRDMISFSGGQDLQGDLDAILTTLENLDGDLAFLNGNIADNMIGMAGHSAGGGAIQGRGDVAKVLMPVASGGVGQGDALESTLIVGGMDDGVSAFSGQQSGYDSAPAPKRLVGIEEGGHLAVSDLCAIRNDDGQNLLEVAKDAKVPFAELGFAESLWDGCTPMHIDPEVAQDIMRYVTAPVLEETLQCKDVGAELDDAPSKLPKIGHYEEEL